MSVYKFLISLIKPFKFQLVFFFFASVIVAIDLPLRPYLLKLALDASAVEGNFESNQGFFFYIFMYLSLMAIVFLINIAYEYIWVNLFLARFKRSIGSMVFIDLINHSYTFYQNNFPGSLGNRLNNCINSVPKIVKALNEEFLTNLLAIIISAYTLHYISLKYSLALVLWASLYIICAIVCAPLVRKKSSITAKESSRGMGYMIDILNNIISLKLFTNKSFEIKTVNHNFRIWENSIKSRDIILVNLYTFQSITFLLFQVLCIYWMLKVDVELNNISPGNLILFFSISSSIYRCLLGLTRTIADFSENLGILSEALNIIYSPKEMVDNPVAGDLECPGGQINFNKVDFHYKGTESLFQKLSLSIKAGQKIGLVGYSGGGKTTFVNLLLRLYDICGGAILIGGQDIAQVSQDSLRSNIAMIPQDPGLFHRSLLENIRYGKMEASDEEVIEAAKKANAHEFIEKLPQKYESLVGERGVKLSGGQRQRIAIARAILKNAPILILDEATSQLDSVTERAIQHSLLELMKNRTTIVIAHRLSTLIHMDRILVFDKGKIIEDGSHLELLAKDGLYKKLWDTQVGGFIARDKKKDEI